MPLVTGLPHICPVSGYTSVPLVSSLCLAKRFPGAPKQPRQLSYLLAPAAAALSLVSRLHPSLGEMAPTPETGIHDFQVAPPSLHPGNYSGALPQGTEIKQTEKFAIKIFEDCIILSSVPPSPIQPPLSKCPSFTDPSA